MTRYIYQLDGRGINLVVDKVVGDTTYLVEDDHVLIKSDQVYDDLTNEISMSGDGPGASYEVITDRYSREYDNVSVESLTNEQRHQLVEYLESLRIDDIDQEDSPFYNGGCGWSIQDVFYI